MPAHPAVSVPAPSTRRPRRRRPAAAGVGLGLAGGLALVAGLLAPAPAAGQPVPSPYVEEDFTRATAPDFVGYGSACLTGAPAANGLPPSGTHALGGCPTPSSAGGPVPPPGADGHGYLQLTDARTDQSGAALYNRPIPAENGLVVSFEQWQYGPTAVFDGQRRPADGISFFLVDGSATLDAPGAFGGSLGYAQKNDPVEGRVPGVEQGYVGIGLDVLGNHFNDGEGRGSGCPDDQKSPAGTAFPTISSTGPNMVTVRGPGDGLYGYCFLDATHTGAHSDASGWESSLPGQLHGPTTQVSADPVQAERDLEPSKRTVTVEISPGPDPVLTVWIDFHDGRGSQEVLRTRAPGPVPPTYSFGFAGSTGVWSNVHLIRNIKIRRPGGSVTVHKTDAANGAPLPGAVFELWRESNGVAGLQTGGSDPDTRTGDGCATDARGVCAFPGLAHGVYYLRETAVPEGYRLPEQPVTGPFTVGQDVHLTKRISNPRGEPCKGKGKGKGKNCK